MTTAMPPTRFLHLVVGYDGSPPAGRALDAAVRLLQGRIGRIKVVYVAHLSSLAALSPGAIAEMENDFDEIEQELRGQAAGQLDVSGAAWEFERRQGIVADQLIAAATVIAEAQPDECRACSRFDWWGPESQSWLRRASAGSSPRRSASM